MTSKNICPNCAGENMIIKRGTHKFLESGLDNVILVNVEIEKCNDCEEEIVSIPNANQLLKLIGERIILTPNRLTGAEIRFLRKNIYLKVQEFAKILGIHRVTASRWENGHTEPKAAEDRLIRMIYSQYAKVSETTREKLIEMFKSEESKEIAKYLLNCNVYPELSCEIVLS